MVIRFLILLLAAAAQPALAQPDAAPEQPRPETKPAAKTWLDAVPALRTGGERAFQFRQDIDVGGEQLVVHVSFAPPGRTCVVYCDRKDGLPMMIAQDGRMWLFDYVGKQIVATAGGPELFTNAAAGAVRTTWHLRTSFPDGKPRVTIDVDFPSILKALATPDAPRLSADAKWRYASMKNENLELTLVVPVKDPPVPAAFTFKSTRTTPPVGFRFDSFVLDGPPPAWHREMNEEALAKHVTVVDLDDTDALPLATQSRLVKFKSLLNGGALFLVRTALRDDELRQAIEKNNRLRLDLDEIRKNDEELQAVWLKALAEQGITLPKPRPPARPATAPGAK
jgi:hypothetical protein